MKIAIKEEESRAYSMAARDPSDVWLRQDMLKVTESSYVESLLERWIVAHKSNASPHQRNVILYLKVIAQR